MLSEDGNKRFRLCVMAATFCLIMAGIWTVLAITETALAAKGGDKGKPAGGGAPPSGCDYDFEVEFSDRVGDMVKTDEPDPDNPPEIWPEYMNGVDNMPYILI